MRKASKSPPDDELRPEYDFAKMGPPVRGKYFRRFQAGTNVAVLDPDVAEAFPSSAAVNEALRVVLTAGRAVRRSAATRAGRLSHERKKPTR